MISLAVAAALIAQSPPDVRPVDAARQLLAEGNAALDRGDKDRAIALFREAYERFPTSKALYNIALGQRRAGDLAGAYRSLRLYLKAPDTGKAAEAAQKLARLERQLSRTHGLVRVILTELDAEFTLDGRRHVSPWSELLRAGVHRLEVVDERLVRRRMDLHVRAGPEQTFVVEVRPHESPGPTAMPRRSADLPAPEFVGPGPVSGDWRTPTGWTLAGVGIAAGIAGGVWQTTSVLEIASLEGQDGEGPRVDDLEARLPGVYRNAGILYGVGAALLVTGVVILALDDDAEVSAGPGTISIGGRF